MSSIRIHNVPRLADAPEIFEWVSGCLERGQAAGVFASGDRRHPLTGEEQCAVAVEVSSAAGFVTFYSPYPDRPFVWIDLLWVDPPYRRRGVGTALLGEVLGAAGQPPFTLALGTLVGNAAMQTLLQRSGFAPWSIEYHRRVEA